jgi:hypothetical protein
MATILKNKKTSNYLMASAVIAAAVAGYFFLTSKSDKSDVPPIPIDTTSNTGNTTKPPIKGCSSTAGEFPLKSGSGSATNSNAYCENIYVKAVQLVLNQFLKKDGKTALTIDGNFGAKTETALKYYYGGITYVSKAQYDSMMDYL